VVKRAIPTNFFVEPTKFGWAVRAESERLGLFMTQRQALGDVKRRRAHLQATGKRSTLVVTGNESESASGRTPRSFWTRR
jgi:hypothetical protein